MARDYAYDTRYESSPEQKRKRAARGRARYRIMKEKGKAAVKGKDIDHKDGNPLNNNRRNLHITTKHYNRAKH